MSDQTRTEKDSLGEMKVPEAAYFGIQTQRSMETFQISGQKMPLQLLKAVAQVKLAAVRANLSIKKLDEKKGKAIEQALEEILAGKFDDEFVTDAIQGGATTSVNMNVNEVAANRALEILGEKKGDYSVLSPVNDVNMSQSTNDVMPTALRLTCLAEMMELSTILEELIQAFQTKGEEFAEISKLARTHLQDAVPIKLGQEMAAYGRMVEQRLRVILENRRELMVVNLGGTAVGTGINGSVDYDQKVIEELSRIVEAEIKLAEDRVAATQSLAVFADVSAVLRNLAIDLIKIANDLRLLASGPKGGLGEIRLPVIQPGSSIMPGKVNPVIPEVINQIGFVVMGNDMTISLACQAGQLELNTMLPVVASRLLESFKILRTGVKLLTEKCVRGIEANEDNCRDHLENSTALATALSQKIGYEKAAELAKKTISENMSFKEVVMGEGVLTEEEWIQLSEGD